MPEMNGLALLRQLRSVDADFPFLMITGRGDYTSVTEAKGAGVSGYILKPYSMAQLEAKLRIMATRAQKLAGGD
jgi:two-component system chemotaxis response regulator CheY